MKVLFATVLLVSTVASAQMSALGGPSSVAAGPGMATIRWPDVAFDPTRDVYLGVTGASNIQGQYWSSNGAPVGQSFVVNEGSLYSHAPRVAYAPGPDVFLVAFHVSLPSNDTQIHGRLLRYNEAPLTGDFEISSVGTNWEMGAAVSWSETSREFLVAWQASDTSIRAQRVSEQGVKVGAEIVIASAARYQRDPAVGYSEEGDQFLVAYGGCVGTDDCFVEAQRVKAGSGALLGSPLTLDVNIAAGYTPEIAFNAITKQWLVVWNRRTPGSATFQGRRVASDGTLGPTTQVSARYGSYDANGLAWNPVSNTFAFVTHGSNELDAVIELDALGAPLDDVGVLVGVSGTNGNYNPRVCANVESAEWMVITSTVFASLTTQRVGTATRDMTGIVVDAGTSEQPDAGTGSTADGGTEVSDAGVSTPDAGTPGSAPGVESASGGPDGALGGCGCNGTALSPLLVLALLALARSGSRNRLALTRRFVIVAERPRVFRYARASGKCQTHSLFSSPTASSRRSSDG